MRHIFIQTSLEFLLILSSILLLSALTITIVNSSLKGLNKVNFDIKTYNVSIKNNPNIDLIYSNYSLFDMPTKLYILVYGCSNGFLKIYFNSNSIKFEYTNISTPISISKDISQYIVPSAIGLNNFSVQYNLSCNNVSYKSSLLGFIYTYSINSFSNNLSFSIKQYNTSMLVNNKSNFTYLDIFSHCTYLSFSYKPLPMNVQCGTSDGWYYMMFSDYCYTFGYGPTTTTCIIPKNTSYYISKPNYLYNINVSIISNQNVYYSLLSSYRPYNILLSDNNVFGNATSKVNEDIELIGNSSNVGMLNYSLFNLFNTTKYNLYSLLSFYNGSDINSNQQSQINEEIYSYNKLLSKIEKFAPINCSRYDNVFICKTKGFNYTIIIRSQFLTNTSLTYDGSNLLVEH